MKEREIYVHKPKMCWAMLYHIYMGIDRVIRSMRMGLGEGEKGDIGRRRRRDGEDRKERWEGEE